MSAQTIISKLFKNKLYLAIVILALGLILSGIYYRQSTLFKPGEKLAAKVKNEKITLDFANQFAASCNLNQKQAVELLVDDKVLLLWAQDENVTLSSQEQEAEEIRISGKPAANDCVTIQARVNLLAEKIGQNIYKFRQGKFIVVNFGFYNKSPYPLPQLQNEEERQKNLEKERAYADQLVKSVYQQIKNGELSFEQAMEKVQQDPSVGLNSVYSTAPQTGPFTAKDYNERRGLSNLETVRQKIDLLSAGQFSEPFVLQIQLGDPEIHGQEYKTPVDSSWIVAKVDRIGKGETGNPEQLLERIKNKYQTKIYI